ncbi:RcnB family protein [Sphingomonas sp. I4]
MTTYRSGPVRDARWGSQVGGRWWGGANAPGGWRAYRRPVRGMIMPSYWNDPRFGVQDWAVYTLPQPPVGYRWSRYYDDAVLIDPRGSVYDSVSGVNWDGAGPTPCRHHHVMPGVTTAWVARRSARLRAVSRATWSPGAAIGWEVR